MLRQWVIYVCHPNTCHEHWERVLQPRRVDGLSRAPLARHVSAIAVVCTPVPPTQLAIPPNGSACVHEHTDNLVIASVQHSGLCKHIGPFPLTWLIDESHRMHLKVGVVRSLLLPWAAQSSTHAHQCQLRIGLIARELSREGLCTSLRL